ncbi:hypothetical protein [Enterococcus sp. AZ103]|uniref:hypothetical protein n=1 Tax=Enterococcus sp. AZ103 TaxID=2774628 RepID=UPI003F205AD4
MKENIPYIEPSQKDKIRYLKRQKITDIILILFCFIVFIGSLLQLHSYDKGTRGFLIVEGILTLLLGVVLYSLVAAVRKKYVLKDGDLLRLKIKLTKKQYLKRRVKVLKSNRNFWIVQTANLFFILKSMAKYFFKIIIYGMFYYLIGWVILLLYSDGTIDLANEQTYLRILQNIGILLMIFLLVGMSFVLAVRRKVITDLQNYSQQSISLFILLLFSSIAQFQKFIDTYFIAIFLFSLSIYLLFTIIFYGFMKKIKKVALKENDEEKLFGIVKDEVVSSADLEESKVLNAIKPVEAWEQFIYVNEITKDQVFYHIEGHGSEGLITDQQIMRTSIEITYKVKYSMITFKLFLSDQMNTKNMMGSYVNSPNAKQILDKGIGYLFF